MVLDEVGDCSFGDQLNLFNDIVSNGSSEFLQAVITEWPTVDINCPQFEGAGPIIDEALFIASYEAASVLLRSFSVLPSLKSMKDMDEDWSKYEVPIDDKAQVELHLILTYLNYWQTDGTNARLLPDIKDGI